MSETQTTQTQPEQGAETKTATPADKPSVADQVALATQALVAGADTSEFSEEVIAAATNRKEADELRQQLEASQGQVKQFQEKAAQVDPYTLLSKEQQDELTELKTTNVDEYFQKRNQYEREAKAKFTESEKAPATEAEVNSKLEVAISLHNARNPELPVSRETLENDIPLRLNKDLTEKLSAGLITPADAVNAVAEYLRGAKKIGGTTPPTPVPTLSDAPGHSTLPEQEQGDSSDGYQAY